MENAAFALQKLKEYKSQENWDAMIVMAKDAMAAFPTDMRFKKWLHTAQAHYVEAKLHSQIVKDLEKNKNYITLHQIYQKLLQVFPESKKLKRLLRRVERKIRKAHGQDQLAYVTKAREVLTRFTQAENWDEARSACYEFLEKNPRDRYFSKQLKCIEQKRKQRIEPALDQYFKETLPALLKSYQADKKAFVVL